MKIGIDAIYRRVSVRTYDPAPLGPEAVAALEAAFLEAVPGPFGRKPRFTLVSRDGGAHGGKIGTYGVISGATTFIAGVVETGDFACVDFGYSLEGIILRATELGLGTCWLGGVFDRAVVKRALGAGRTEFCPATSPVGKASGKLGLQDRLIRAGADARNSKDASELFFSAGEDGSWFPLGTPGSFAPLLEAVRLGPSASNKQPWRLVADRRGPAEALHLFMQEERFYNNMLGAVKLQEIDMGIAMRHVEVAAASAGIQGSWNRLGASPVKSEGTRRYIASWTAAPAGV